VLAVCPAAAMTVGQAAYGVEAAYYQQAKPP